MLATLIHANHDSRLRVVGAYRDTDVKPADALSLFLGDAAQAGLVRQRPLGPLETAEASALLRSLLASTGQVDGPIVEQVLARAGGVPFFLISYAQAIEQGGPDGVPWDLAQGVRRRMALVPEARDLLEATAVIGRRIPRALLMAVSALPDAEALSGLEAACAARLLIEDGSDTYAFAHDTIREVVESDLGSARSASLHQRIAEALENQPGGASPELLAYHYGHTLSHDKAARYLETAGDHARDQYAYDSAERRYREVVEHLQALGRDQEAPPVWEKLGEMLYRCGRYDQALAVLDQASAAYRVADNVEGEMRVTASIARTYGASNNAELGIGRIESLVEHTDVTRASPAVLTATYAALDLLLRTTGRYTEAVAANRQAAELARTSGDDRSRLLAESNRFHLLIKLSRMDEALELAEEILRLAEQLGDPDLIVSAHLDLGFNRAAQGAFEIARMHIDRACEVAPSIGKPQILMVAVAVRGWLAFLRGDWATARADLEQAVALGSEGNSWWYETYPLLFLTRLSLAEGDLQAASIAAAQALTLAEQGGDVQGLRWISSAMAEIDILRRRPEAALERLIPWLDRPGMEESDVTDFLPVLAWAHLAAGQIGQATEVVEQALARARAQNAMPVVAEALRVQSLIALRQGDWQGAAACLEEGLALARDMPYPYAEARLLTLDGERLSAQGEHDSARGRWEEALNIFQALARPRIGHGILPVPPAMPPALSPGAAGPAARPVE